MPKVKSFLRSPRFLSVEKGDFVFAGGWSNREYKQLVRASNETGTPLRIVGIKKGVEDPCALLAGQLTKQTVRCGNHTTNQVTISIKQSYSWKSCH